MGLLSRHPSREITERMLSLLGKDDCTWRQGLAAYYAMQHARDRALPLAAELLKSDEQLLRFDAICALWMSGGERGRDLVQEHMNQEKHPWLQRFYSEQMQRR